MPKNLKDRTPEVKESLNDQQKTFCEAKLFNNKVKAYMIAYPDCKYKSASASAARLLEDARIIKHISLLKNNIEEITGVSKIRNVAELAKIAYSTIAHLHNTWTELNEFNKLSEDEKACIEIIDTKIEEKPIYNTELEKKENINIKYVKIKLYSKIAAIDQINKMMGYNEAEKHEHSGEIKGDLSSKSTDELIVRAKAIKHISNDKSRT